MGMSAKINAGSLDGRKHSVDAEGLDHAQKVFFVKTEGPGRGSTISLVLTEGIENQPPSAGVQCCAIRQWLRRYCHLDATDSRREVLQPNHWTVAKDERPLDHIGQLTGRPSFVRLAL